MKDQMQNIGIDVIDDPHAPVRTAMDEEKLVELANSIKLHGLIQPITVRKVGPRYEVIAGHRRLKACRRAGVALVPSIVREVNDAKADELRMAENLYREDVNPVDEARYIRRMIDVHKCEPA
jgi:ParB family chromosome partitioning protein